MESYVDLKTRQQKAFNAFPMKYAFSEAQFKESMEELGLKATDTDQIFKFGNSVGFYRKSDSKALLEMIKRHDSEMSAAIEGDPAGEGFIFEMFNYELGNHEYAYTGTLTPTLEALGLSMDEINKNSRLLNGLEKAIKAQREERINYENKNKKHA